MVPRRACPATPGTGGATTTRRRAFPYEDLRRENGRRGKLDPEYELLDTGAFDDDRYWIVEVHYAKADPGDLLMSVQVTNAGPEPDTLHVLPTAWFRNTWSWEVDGPRPGLEATGAGSSRCTHPFLGELELLAGPGPDGAEPMLLFCENETNTERLYGSPATTPYPKDGINDHVLTGAATVNPDQRGTKCAFWHRLTVDAGRDRRAAAAAAAGGLAGRAGDGAGSGLRRVSRGAGPRPTSSTPS